jgi:hypothetical protein
VAGSVLPATRRAVFLLLLELVVSSSHFTLSPSFHKP